MSAPAYNAQRGCYYAPQAARAAREKREQRLAHARMLDQIEHAYRERKRGRRGKWSS